MEHLLEGYIESHIEKEPTLLADIERESNLGRVNGRMCSGHIQGRLLKMLTRMIAPKRALEMGTFTGYSALCIAEGMAPGGELITIEVDDELEESIRDAFERSEYGDRIKLMIGDAVEICSHLESESFDLIFIDADKRDYPEYYREAKRMLRPGGYILADNTLWDGHVVEKEPKDRQTLGIMEFNDMVSSDRDMEVAIVPIRDGLSIIRRREE